jgi:cation diffusion facilitator family transporter
LPIVSFGTKPLAGMVILYGYIRMGSRFFIYISLAADILIAVSKFIAAGITGSSSMISEAVHSIIDAISQVMLIWGIKASKKKPDEERPFGYGKEFYFWSFVVSLIIFLMGGCISVYEGIMRIKEPDFKGSPEASYIVLGIALVFTAISAAATLKAFNRQKQEGASFFEAITRSKDPSTFILLLGDIGDLLGIVIAFLGIYLGRLFHNPYYDGVASIIIGLVLVAISMLLVRESKSLLMGETIGKKTLRKIVSIAEADAGVIKVKKQFSMYMAPEEVLLQLIAVFKAGLTTDEITTSIERISKVIQKEFPRIKQIFIEPVHR